MKLPIECLVKLILILGHWEFLPRDQPVSQYELIKRCANLRMR